MRQSEMPESYLELLKLRLEGHEANVPFFIGAKHQVRKVAKLLGIRTPEIFYTGPLSGVPWDNLPSEFVLKPTFASTSIGIFLVESHDGAWRDAVSRRPLTKEEIIDKERLVSARFFNGDEAKGDFIVEKLLRDRDGTIPPRDVRVNAFFGEIGMIYLDDHLTGKVATASYFDGNFVPFEDVAQRYGIANGTEERQRIVNSPTPETANEILRVAKLLSLALPTSFARLDFYDTPEGVYLGEITFTPGAFYYRNAKLMHPLEDHRLGVIWKSAIERFRSASGGC